MVVAMLGRSHALITVYTRCSGCTTLPRDSLFRAESYVHHRLDIVFSRIHRHQLVLKNSSTTPWSAAVTFGSKRDVILLRHLSALDTHCVTTCSKRRPAGDQARSWEIHLSVCLWHWTNTGALHAIGNMGLSKAGHIWPCISTSGLTSTRAEMNLYIANSRSSA
jgi:hypothetical protein